MESDIYGNTALPLAPDLQSPSNPTEYTDCILCKEDRPHTIKGISWVIHLSASGDKASIPELSIVCRLRIYPNTLPRVGGDTMSIFRESVVGFNLEISFCKIIRDFTKLF